jgi:nicotinamide-nucleotide amidase
VVTYSDASKRRRLGVPASLLERHGAVSGPVARAMAEGIRRRSGSDFGLGITGIAGPTGGSPRKPVGLVYIALSYSRGTALRRNNFIGGREQVKYQSSQKALDLLRSHLTKTGKRR